MEVRAIGAKIPLRSKVPSGAFLLEKSPIFGLPKPHHKEQEELIDARDRVSRWDVVEVQERATSRAAAHFLDTMINRMPLLIAALQVDGGSEFAAKYEQVCQQRGLPLFVLPSRSPRLKGHLERSHRTHHEEFYQVIPDDWNVAHLNPQLRRWEQIYNTVRSHQALGYLTPHEFLERRRSQPKKADGVSIIM
jgi:transposase InsO family protein